MKTSLDSVQGQWLEEKDARQRAEALLLEKERKIALLVQQNETLQAQLSAVEDLKKELRNVFEVVNHVQDIIFITDAQGIFRFVNPIAAQLLGFPMSEMLGKHFAELVREDYAPLIRDQYREQIRQGLPSSYVEFPVRNVWGREIWLGQRVSFLYQDGKLLETYSISRDISEEMLARKELTTTYSRLEGLVQNLHAGVLVESEARKIVLINQQFCDLFYIPVAPELLIGADCAAAAEQSKDLFCNPDEFVQRIDELLKRRVLVLSDELTMRNGTILERHYIPVFSDDQYMGHMWHYRDITEQKRLQADLERAREEAEHARDAEKAFLANMSHEIRNPINSIVGMTNLLYDTTLNQEQVEYVNALKYSADLLQALVSDVLDIAKIEQGKMEPKFEGLDFFNMAKTMCKTFEFRLSQRPVEFQCEIAPEFPKYLKTDPTFLSQILFNLINNSIKFTEQGFIRCSASLKMLNDKPWIEFTVTDSGIGITKDRLPFIFERFNQAGKAKNSRDGAGLGLPITKQLVELMGGSIQVSSEAGVGTSFRVNLPYEAIPYPNPVVVETTAHQLLAQSDRLHVLIVEDNAMNRRYLEGLLSKWGLTYKTADDGVLALQILEKEPFDLILMDIRMPNMDGYETTLRLRNAYQNPNQQTPIIALTASALLDEKQKALQAGMNQHLAKPFSPDQLLDVFQRCFPNFSPTPLVAPFTITINHQELMELYEGDKTYMREIFGLFLQSIPLELAEMRQLLELSDWKGFVAKAHKIKPSFKMVGLGVLSTRAEQLERARGAFDPNELSLDFELFETEIVQALQLVQAELGKLSFT